MPEGPEIETEKLHETIHEELEHEGGTFLKRIALTTAATRAGRFSSVIRPHSVGRPGRQAPV